MGDYRKLDLWERAHAFVLAVYRETRPFPAEERFGITAQLRRAAVSTPTNIVEGCGRNTDREFARFLDIALGSANETDYLLLLSRDLGFLGERQYAPLENESAELRRMIVALTTRVRG